MTIRPVVLSGMIQRTDDVGTLKQQADNKPVVDQQHIQMQVKKEEQKLAHQVQEMENAEMMETKYDAKDEGKGQYQRRKNKKKQGKAKDDDSKVVMKGLGGSFDIKI